MLEEIVALEQNKNGTLTDFPEVKKAVGSEWVYTIKFKTDGIIEKLKARLVIKGPDKRFWF